MSTQASEESTGKPDIVSAMKELRLALGMNQGQFANALGYVSGGMVAQYETRRIEWQQSIRDEAYRNLKEYLLDRFVADMAEVEKILPFCPPVDPPPREEFTSEQAESIAAFLAYLPTGSISQGRRA